MSTTTVSLKKSDKNKFLIIYVRKRTSIFTDASGENRIVDMKLLIKIFSA